MAIDSKRVATVKWAGKLEPTFCLPKTQPVPLTSASVRRVLTHLLDHGSSSHSATGATLWAVLDYLQRTGTPYVLNARPGEGYLVTLVKES